MRLDWLAGLATVSILTGIAILISLGVPGGVIGADPPRPPGADTGRTAVASVEIPVGASAAGVAQQLVQAGVITSKRRFETLVALLGYERLLAPGRYDFEPGLITVTVVERIRHGITSPLLVTIPEGLRREEIAGRLEEAGAVRASDFLAATIDPAAWRGTLAADRPEGVSLEGYLFPSTYRFSLRATAVEVVRAMLQRLDEQFTADRLQTMQAAGVSVHEVLTVASIVEREAVLPAEQPLIASVFRNRLDQGLPLEADPTVQYALAQEADSVAQFGYWKPGLTLDDLTTPSPYNTYVNGGLPPTPIASPGLGAIDAAIRPADSPYLYFVARGDGSHIFAVTFAEHQANVETFQGDGE